MLELVPGTYTFSLRHCQALAQLSHDLGPDDPKFVTLNLWTAQRSAIPTTVWYVGRDRFHVQGCQAGAVLPAQLDATHATLQVLDNKEN
jgi:hypothetical protein